MRRNFTFINGTVFCKGMNHFIIKDDQGNEHFCYFENWSSDLWIQLAKKSKHYMLYIQRAYDKGIQIRVEGVRERNGKIDIMRLTIEDKVYM